EVKPVYVLTSSRTFSAAEEFTYNLRNLERATIVGEQTGGGAHPIRTAVINDQFYMSVPYARAVNPITKTNWEGVGVEPHIKTNRDDALDTAHIDALKTLIEKSDTTAKRMEAWEQALMSLEKDS
ncbi:MAG: S41 family peptidase, partial [Planctomycetota bacterium]|nr:S41 family peptidase [Planctomycetota bacterium]